MKWEFYVSCKALCPYCEVLRLNSYTSRLSVYFSLCCHFFSLKVHFPSQNSCRKLQCGDRLKCARTRFIELMELFTVYSSDQMCIAFCILMLYKYLIILCNSRAAEILYSLALVQSSKSEKMSVFPSVDNYKLLTEARRNLGLFQHHDALPGTAKDWVVVDYGTR